MGIHIDNGVPYSVCNGPHCLYGSPLSVQSLLSENLYSHWESIKGLGIHTDDENSYRHRESVWKLGIHTDSGNLNRHWESV